MKTPYLLTVLAASIALSGCSTGKEPAELALEPQSQYDQRYQDGLAPQRYTEAQILYQRQMNEFQGQIDTLEKQRRALEQGLANAAYENDLSPAPASSSEAARVGEFQDASRKTQAKIAKADSELAVRKALLENERDAELLDAQRKATEKLAAIETEYSSLVSSAEKSTRDLIDSRSRQEEELQRATQKLRSQENEILESQRFQLAVENATKVTNARGTMASAEQELVSTKARFETEIANLEQQLASLRARASQEIALKEAQLATAKTEVDRLVSVGEMLKQQKVQSAEPSLAKSEEFNRFVREQESRLAEQKNEIEARKQARIAEVKNGLAAEQNLITSRARTKLAGIESVATIEKSSVVAPVITGRRVYADESVRPSAPTAPAPVAQSAAKPLASAVASKPVTITTFKPKLEPAIEPGREPQDVVIAGGTTNAVASAGAPVVEQVKTREVFDVLYTYTDKPSWEKFQLYLKAYGVNDFLASRNSKKGEWYIYAGRYYDEASAARKVLELNMKTSTNHAKVIRKEIPR